MNTHILKAARKGTDTSPLEDSLHLRQSLFCLALVFFCGCGGRNEDAKPPEDAVQDQVETKELDVSFEWNTYHGDSTLNGVADAMLPDKPVLLWRFKAGAPVHMTPVASQSRIHFANAQGEVFAIDGEGDLLWSKQLTRGTNEEGEPIKERFDAPAACFDSTLFVASIDGTLYALDSETGDQKWVYDVGGSVLSTPNRRTVKSPDGKKDKSAIYVLSQDDGILHCVDFETGKGLWKTEGVERCDGSAAVGENAVVFGSCAAALHVFSSESGEHVFDIEIDDESQVAGGVVLLGDQVFSGSRSGKLIHADSKKGELVWTNEDSKGEIFTTPAVNDKWVLFTSDDGKVYALDRATGKQKWNFDTEGLPYSPVIASDKVAVSVDGVLHLLQLEDGKVLWTKEISDEITSPAIIGGMIIVGNEEGTVSAFGKAKG